MSVCFFFFFNHKTAYEMRISDWSSDVCSSDLLWRGCQDRLVRRSTRPLRQVRGQAGDQHANLRGCHDRYGGWDGSGRLSPDLPHDVWQLPLRSEEHTSELQSLMRISYAVFCLQKKKNTKLTEHKPKLQVRS